MDTRIETNTFQERQVMTFTDWLITLFIASVPIINLIFLTAWSFSENTAPTKRVFARAAFVLILLEGALYLFIFWNRLFGTTP